MCVFLNLHEILKILANFEIFLGRVTPSFVFSMTGGRTGDRTERGTDGWADGRKGGRTERHTGGRTDGRRTNGRADGRTHGQTNGPTDGRGLHRLKALCFMCGCRKRKKDQRTR